MTSPTPATEPTSAALVAGHLSMNPAEDGVLDKLAPTVAAVNRFVRRIHTEGVNGWDADHAHGAMMLAGRLWRRRNSIDGVATFTAEGAAYVQRNDPDVALLLQLGAYAVPVVG